MTRAGPSLKCKKATNGPFDLMCEGPKCMIEPDVFVEDAKDEKFDGSGRCTSALAARRAAGC